MIGNKSKLTNAQRREIWKKENKLKYIKKQLKHWNKKKTLLENGEKKTEEKVKDLLQELPVRYLTVMKYVDLPKGEVMTLKEALIFSRKNKMIYTNDVRIFNYLHKLEIKVKLIPTKSLYYIFNEASKQGYRTYEVLFVENTTPGAHTIPYNL